MAPIAQAHLLEIPVLALPAEENGTFSSSAIEKVAELAERRSATLVGPGMRVTTGTTGIVSRLLAASVPLVVDADGLNCISRLTSNGLDEFPEILRRDAPLVLTPHRAELGRLVGLQDTPPASLTSAMEAARRIVWSDGGSEICVVAKGSATACVSVDVALLPKPGPASLATAGSGDVLGGVMAAQLSRFRGELEELPALAALACETHGYAGALAAKRLGARAVMASDLIAELGLAADELEGDVSLAFAEEG